jgi:hypothetical protein
VAHGLGEDNDRFNVERNLNATGFVKIGVVKGLGAKSAATGYALTDAGAANKTRGPVCCWLKQVDTDGTSSFSPARYPLIK